MAAYDAPPKLFTFRSSLLKERLQLEELQHVRPDYFDAILAFGKRLVDAAESGLTAVTAVLGDRGNIPLIQWHCIRAFNAAIRNRDLVLVQWFVSNGLDLSVEAFKGLLPRLASVKWEDITEFGELLDSLLEGGVDINDTEGDSFSTALHVACARGDLMMVRMLASRDADVNAINRMRLVPAHVARESGVPGSLEVEQFLLSLGAEAKYEISDSYEPPEHPSSLPFEIVDSYEPPVPPSALPIQSSGVHFSASEVEAPSEGSGEVQGETTVPLAEEELTPG